MSWQTHEDPREGPLHIWPDDDLIEHDIDSLGDCVCGPTLECYRSRIGDIWLVIHEALDPVLVEQG